MANLNINLPEDFYKEEIRCGYTVTAEMKKVWAVELDLLAELDRVCKKHNIVYYANGGTILGAVRHQGFIPWDDDLDVMLVRSEYDKLCSVADDFREPYFFQTEKTDPGSIRGHAQLRNSVTTGIVLNEYPYRDKLPFNQGIFIDIFPLDNIPANKKRRKSFYQALYREEKFFCRYRDHFYDIDTSTGVKKAVKDVYFSIKNVFAKHRNYYNKHYWKFEKIAKTYNNKNTRYVGTVIFENDHFKKSILGKPAYAQFEFMKIPVPKHAEEYLTAIYGDWHKFVKGGSAHKGIIFDTDVPYKEYIKAHEGERKSK